MVQHLDRPDYRSLRRDLTSNRSRDGAGIPGGRCLSSACLAPAAREAERILACHPQVHGGGELLEIGRLMAGLRQRLPRGEYYPKAMRPERGTV